MKIRLSYRSTEPATLSSRGPYFLVIVESYALVAVRVPRSAVIFSLEKPSTRSPSLTSLKPFKQMSHFMRR